jgi:hypothetical protein
VDFDTWQLLAYVEIMLLALTRAESKNDCVVVSAEHIQDLYRRQKEALARLAMPPTWPDEPPPEAA